MAGKQKGISHILRGRRKGKKNPGTKFVSGMLKG